VRVEVTEAHAYNWAEVPGDGERWPPAPYPRYRSALTDCLKLALLRGLVPGTRRQGRGTVFTGEGGGPAPLRRLLPERAGRDVDVQGV